jgi:hypothetical protein
VGEEGFQKEGAVGITDTHKADFYVASVINISGSTLPAQKPLFWYSLESSFHHPGIRKSMPAPSFSGGGGDYEDQISWSVRTHWGKT